MLRRARTCRVRRALLLALATLGTSACASGGTAPGTVAPAPVAPATGAVASPPTAIPNELRWYRSSAERRALYLQAYRTAESALARHVAGLTPNGWAVILDADETVIDNSLYEQELVERHAKYDPASWKAWVLRRAATALPGAVAFTARVHALGGRVVIVTNRDAVFCDPTRENLQRAGIVADELLCRTDPANDSKDPRFDAVMRGVAPSTLPPLQVVMWVGDNIQDFPRLTQQIRLGPDADFAPFGERFIVLPNPMYGSWEHNPLP
jgi:5'-nucleotidase (lipoprotein e(P4) family)